MGDPAGEDRDAAAGDLGDAVLLVRRQLGARMRRRRRQLGLSQERLSERVGFSHNYIAHVERGSRGVSLASLVRFARALRIPLAWLFSPAGPAERGPSRADRRRESSADRPAA